MKPRERVVTALNCRTPDRVPVVEYLFSPKLQREVLGYTTPLYDPPTQLALAHKLGFDGLWIPINGFCGMEEEVHRVGSSYQDEWGVTYLKDGWPIMVQTATPIKSRADWKRYAMPKAAAPHRTALLSAAIKANPHDLAIIAGFVGPFTMMYWYLMDLETLALTIYDDPDLVREMTAAFTAWTLECAQLVADLGGVDAFSISDDWGGTMSLLMSPRHLREFFIPPFRDIVQGMKRLGLPVIMHNDGRIWEVLDDLVDTGISAFHPVERAAGMDLGRVKERYRGRLCPIGNINNKTTMVTGTPDDVRREALECLRVAAPGGGYILATDHSLHDDIPLENVLAYVDVARQYGSYRLRPASEYILR